MYTYCMESFSSLLEVGGKTNSLGRSQEIIEVVQDDPSRLAELFECVCHEDAWVRMRAIDTFEKVIRQRPELAGPYLADIFGSLMDSTQASIQWHLAQLFTEVRLSPREQKKAINWLTDKLSTTDVDWIVSVNCMKAMMYFYQKKLALAADVQHMLSIQLEHRSKSVRKKVNAFMQQVHENEK